MKKGLRYPAERVRVLMRDLGLVSKVEVYLGEMAEVHQVLFHSPCPKNIERFSAFAVK